MILLKLLKINKWVGGERILKDISLEIVKGEFIAIIGPSGSGKSSLLYIMGLLDCPSSGDIFYRGKPINFAEANTISRLRNEKMGFVFQFHYLIPELNLIENVMAPQIRKGISLKEAKERAETLLVRLGLKGKEKRQVFEISGGEMQRVAIARALANSRRFYYATNLREILIPKIPKRLWRFLKKSIRKAQQLCLLPMILV